MTEILFYMNIKFMILTYIKIDVYYNDSTLMLDGGDGGKKENNYVSLD